MSIELNKPFFLERAKDAVHVIENGPAFDPNRKYVVRYATDVPLLLERICELEEELNEREESKVS